MAPLSRYYEPYRKRIAEQFRTQQAAWQASNAAVKRKEEQPAQQADHAASIVAGQQAAAADGERSAAASAEEGAQGAELGTGAGLASQRVSQVAEERAAAATGAANTRQPIADDRLAEAAEVSDQQQGSGARQQEAGTSTEGQNSLRDPLLPTVARQSDVQAAATSEDAVAASESSVASSLSDAAAASQTADASGQQIGAQMSFNNAQLRGGTMSSIRLGERT